jgi:hypothetical protein
MGKIAEPQAARLADLEAEGNRLYTYPHKGRSIIDAFRRYLESDDPAKITAPLRDFLMMVCGFIAHFDLSGFRCSYPNAHLLLQELTFNHGVMGMLLCGHRSAMRVYADGMTDVEVCDEIASLVSRFQERAERNYAEAVAAQAERTVIAGAQLLGWAVVPAGFKAIPAESAAGEDSATEAKPELRKLAESRGLRLVPESQLF